MRAYFKSTMFLPFCIGLFLALMSGVIVSRAHSAQRAIANTAQGSALGYTKHPESKPCKGGLPVQSHTYRSS